MCREVTKHHQEVNNDCKKILIVFSILVIVGGVLTAVASALPFRPSCSLKWRPPCGVTTTTTTSTTTSTTISTPTSTTTTVTSPPPPPSNGMPIASNTGPSGINGTMTAAQFLSTGVCDHKRITDQVRDESAAMLNRTFTINNCALDGGLYYANYSTYSDSAFPVVNIQNSSIYNWLMFSPMKVTADRVYVAEGGFWVPCPDCAAQDHADNQTRRAMPVIVTNSWFHKSRPPDGGFYHSEALHVVGGGIGYRFNNVRFTQDGPWSDSTTGTIKFTGRDSTFTNVFFDWNGMGVGSYFTTYFEGANVSVNGCRVENGHPQGGYEFTPAWSPWGGGGVNGYSVPPLTNCVDWYSGARI